MVFQVNFVGEGSVDTGGPRREFFRLLAEEAKSAYFHSSSDSAGKHTTNIIAGFVSKDKNITFVERY